jgi:deoxyribodipyrimidine photolyase-related protein
VVSAGRKSPRLRRLVLVLGDQLGADAPTIQGCDPERDALWMAEVEEESTHVRCHQLRIAGFLAAMRHFRDERRAEGLTVHYTELAPVRDHDRGSDFAAVLGRDLERLRPQELVVTRPGDWRVLASVRATASKAGIALVLPEDTYFYTEPAEFTEWAGGRKELVLESFYREMRRRHDVLLDAAGAPVGGRWNFDHDNREAFGRAGPGRVRPPRAFPPDETTRAVIELVRERFPDHPGRLDRFALPVTRRDARAALRDFVAHRLPRFGAHEDAMWEGEPFLFHSRLSFALNVKLLGARECVQAAVGAFESGRAPLASVEGFVRQILGWREFVRGVYWRLMPEYADRNALGCEDRDVPASFWDGQTEMACVRDAMRNVLDHAYAHHIQRLMVTGLFAQLLGVHPRRFHEWHMAMYLDAVDWVSLPNTLGMSQYGDGGVVGTKPYCASGKYVDRMSNHCRSCRYDPRQALGEGACPITTLYWDFLARHQEQFRSNRRMRFQLGNLARRSESEVAAIRRQARGLVARMDRGERP